jgi:hypothetical protein
MSLSLTKNFESRSAVFGVDTSAPVYNLCNFVEELPVDYLVVPEVHQEKILLLGPG